MERQEIIGLAEKHGFDLDGRELVLNESGLDFFVVLFEDASGVRWVLRIPRRDDVQSEVEKEKRILDVVVPNLKVEAPDWKVMTSELIAYKALTGIPAGTINQEEKRYDWVIDPENLPESFVESLAVGMVSLHGIPLAAVENGGLAAQTINEVRSSLQKRMEVVKQEFGVSATLWERWQRWMQDDSLWPQHTAFIHGDLHAGHILVDEAHCVTGFIDWTEAKVADASTDFIGHLRAHGEEQLEQLITAYGEAGGRVWPGMKEHIVELAATYPLDIADFALKSGIQEYLDMAKAALYEEH